MPSTQLVEGLTQRRFAERGRRLHHPSNLAIAGWREPMPAYPNLSAPGLTRGGCTAHSEAQAFAEADPYRAATHNGIMNGIDGWYWHRKLARRQRAHVSPRVLAYTGYQLGTPPRATWSADHPAGSRTVGGATKSHPGPIGTQNPGCGAGERAVRLLAWRRTCCAACPGDGRHPPAYCTPARWQFRRREGEMIDLGRA